MQTKQAAVEPPSRHPAAAAPDRVIAWLMAILMGTTAVFVLFQQIDLLDYRLWEDETETIMTARMMVAGHRLYDDIFNLHGPLVFLPAWLLALCGNPGIVAYRLLVVALQWAGLLALVMAPIPGTPRVRSLIVMAAAVAMVVVLPWNLGHTYQYQTVAGVITLCVLALSVMPAIAGAPPVGAGMVVLANALLICLPFLAISYAPATVLLFAAGLRRERIKAALFGVALGATANLIFLFAMCSVVGYLAYHIYLNLRVLPPFLPRNPAIAFIVGVLSPDGLARWEIRRGITEALWVIAPCGIFWLLCTRGAQGGAQRRLPSWRAWLTLLAFASFLVRGSGFQATPFWYGALAIPLLMLTPGSALVARRVWFAPAIGFAWVVLLIVGMGLNQPVLAGRRIPQTTEFAELARRITAPGDQVLVYTFNSFQYIVADRLPASGYFFYLPLQQAYDRVPLFGFRIDPCADIRAARPKLLMIAELRLYGFPRETHDGCLGAIVANDYTQIAGKPYFVRNDLARAPTASGALAP